MIRAIKALWCDLFHSRYAIRGFSHGPRKVCAKCGRVVR